MLIVLASIASIAGVAKTILGVGGLIFVHELGHFLVGIWCGVHAEAFSLGFGPVIFKWYGAPRIQNREDSRTEFRISAIPLGGYVKFLGENPDERAEGRAPDPRSFQAASYPRKVAIMLAGVTMNLAAAFVLFTYVFEAGYSTTPPVVGDVAPGMPAWEHGIKAGDEIVSIDGKRTLDFMDLRQETLFAASVDVVVRRPGAGEMKFVLPTRTGPDGMRAIGVAPPATSRLVVEEGGAAAKAGFRTDDRVVAVDGKRVSDAREALRLHEDARRDTTWTVERDGARIDVKFPWTPAPGTPPKIRLGFVEDSSEIVVRDGGPAQTGGFASGDRPASVGGIATTSAARFVKLVADPSVTGEAVVLRGDRRVSVPLRDAENRKEFADSIAPGAGIGPVRGWLPDGPGPAREAGFPDGAEILAIDGHAVTKSSDCVSLVQKAASSNRRVEIRRRDWDGRDGSTTMEPRAWPESDLGGLDGAYETRTFRASGLGEAASLAAERTARWIERIFHTLGSVFTDGATAGKLSGPLGISRGAYQTAKSSLGEFLMFLAMLSMNLAVLNVLPLPLLDGGQLAVHTIERIRRRPIPEKVLETVMWTGLILLVGFVVFVTKNDILNMMR